MTLVYDNVLWRDHEIVDAIVAWARERGRPPCGLDWRWAGYGHPSAVTVREHFESFPNALRAAGFDVEPRRGGYEPRWTSQRVVEAILDHRFRTGRWPTAREWWRPHGGPRTGEAERPSTGTVRRVFGSWGAAMRAAGRTGSLRVNRKLGAVSPPTEEELRRETDGSSAADVSRRWRERNPEKVLAQAERRTQRRREQRAIAWPVTQ